MKVLSLLLRNGVNEFGQIFSHNSLNESPELIAQE